MVAVGVEEEEGLPTATLPQEAESCTAMVLVKSEVSAGGSGSYRSMPISLPSVEALDWGMDGVTLAAMAALIPRLQEVPQLAMSVRSARRKLVALSDRPELEEDGRKQSGARAKPY